MLTRRPIPPSTSARWSDWFAPMTPLVPPLWVNARFLPRFTEGERITAESNALRLSRSSAAGVEVVVGPAVTAAPSGRTRLSSAAPRDAGLAVGEVAAEVVALVAGVVPSLPGLDCVSISSSATMAGISSSSKHTWHSS